MSNKRYYFLKLKEDFFQDATIQILEGQQDGLLYTNLLLKLYLMALKNEGRLMLTEDIPYTPAMLAALTRHQVSTVEAALDIFKRLGMVEVLEDGALFMSNLPTLLGISSSEADRKRKERASPDKNSLSANEWASISGQNAGVAAAPSDTNAIAAQSPKDNTGNNAPLAGRIEDKTAADMFPDPPQKIDPGGQKADRDGQTADKRPISAEFTQNAPTSGQNADICPKFLDSGALAVDILGNRTVKCPTEYRDKRIDNRVQRLERRTPAPVRTFGRYQNVVLSDDELNTLQQAYPDCWETMIENLSCYMASSGKKYQNHLATMEKWARKDAEAASKPATKRDYSVKEGETV